ncbi:hypothetical protein L2D14_14120 [Thalassospiraceae bacterium LMO-JJ14]|nr:hypothetical protein L2D14_14120 [Thalassospiraceae bacterium LMO-JJ14]
MNKVPGPFVIVHNIGDVHNAVAAASKLGRPVTLISPPGAGASMGPEVFKHMVEAGIDARIGSSSRDSITAVFDCASEPGQAMAAIQAGIRHIRIDAGDDVRRKLCDMVGEDGSVLDGTPLSAFDPGSANKNNDTLLNWLSSQSETTT